MCGSLFLSAGKLFYPQQRVKPFRRSGGLPPQARLALLGRGLFAMTWRGECRRLAAETRGDVGHLRFPMSPLDTPLTFRWPLSEAFAAKRGLRGLGSVRRIAYGTLSGPEVSLRDLPRITVRGHPVQGVCFPLRKAPLPSSVDPWSTRRPCGPLAFRRATEGSRVQRKVGGVKRGQETIWCPVPFCPCRWAPTPPAAEGGHCPRSLRA